MYRDHYGRSVHPGEVAHEEIGKIATPGKRTRTEVLQRKARPIGTAALAPAPREDDTARAGFAGGAGAPPYREEMERAFGADFSSVRAHAGPEAAAACRALGAEAYTVGSDVAFATASPARDLVAHELAHVVQQTEGIAARRDGGGGAGALEAEADAAAAEVAAGGPVTGRLSAAGPWIAKRLALGTVCVTARLTPDPAESPFGALTGPPAYRATTTTVYARTTREWLDFLREQADDGEGMLELAAFMAAASGVPLAAGNLSYLMGHVRRPTDDQAVKLMIALLTVGDSIDLADCDAGTGPEFQEAMARSMAAFYAQFTAPALARMSREGGVFQREDVENVAALAEETEDMGGDPSAVQDLIASALGTAVGAASAVLQAPDTPEGRDSVRGMYVVTRNAAMTIRGALDHLEASEATNTTLIMSIVNGAAGAITGPLEGVASAIVGGLMAAATTWIGSWVGGDPRERVRDLKDDFTRAIQTEGDARRVDPNTIASLQSIFSDTLDY